MTTPVLEIAEFRTTGETSDFVAAAEAITPWLAAQPGFRARRLAQIEEGAWIDCVEWNDMESAKSAADRIMETDAAAAFMARIDFSSLTMRHARIVISR
ncbi:MAG: hypothetical protein IM673_13215 [Phenylobacterium sp.]|uniref:hypothetical protein n=1 Tax=Phenylobacterium sp. TaxID=1871053 RepID=UPI0025DC3644|nr:hypothetical protein [Phenylobacterium sp.]MCA3729391.1 hypothetical protein [Phenylobacterium sp.]MCA3733509.1 hypothetical protein [Phenylobacterium sp.]MCA3738998.1 hypothetical protein [Phenylobacterium sp.]MCA4915729.1 hypothetical protein [Phenylobacterium sp.]MCA6255084.1 hypothetical protein [Phenylobacterium sp.]